MFFRRKKKKAEELREHYRRAPGKKHALGLQVQVAADRVLPAGIDNLSAGGVGVRFAPGSDPQLVIGADLMLTFTSLGPGKHVVAPGRVVGVRGSEADGVLYGVQFTDIRALFGQLDSYLLRFFNRRKAMRVLPQLGKKLPVTATVPSGEVRVLINDLSWMGMSFILDPAEAEAFLSIEEFGAKFSLSKASPEIQTQVRIVHKTLTGAKVLFGGYFVNPDQRAGDEQREQLEAYAKAREEDMARWDSA